MQNIWDGKAQTTNYDENGNEINQNIARNERTEAGWRVEEAEGRREMLTYWLTEQRLNA